jgi:hypothetical protein
VAPLTEGQGGRVLNRCAAAAGLPQAIVNGFLGHSPRIGAAQDTAVAGIDLASMMQAGGWKTAAMMARYNERLATGLTQTARVAWRCMHGHPKNQHEP